MVQKILSVVVNAKVATFASVVATTEVKIPKKWGFTDVVTCKTEKGIQLNYSYESAVNRHRKAEDKATDFVAESLPWGEWLIPNLVITHKGKHYLRVYDYAHNVKSKTYYVGGREATEAEVAIITAWQKSKKHTSRQGVDNEVKPSVIEFGNIQYLACGGQKYIK